MVRSSNDVTRGKQDALLHHVQEVEGLYREWRNSVRSGDIESFVSALASSHAKYTDAQWNHLIDAFTKEVDRTGKIPKHTLHFRKKGYWKRNFHSRDVAVLLFVVGVPLIAILVLIVVLRTLYW